MAITLEMIGGTLVTIRPDAAATIRGAAEAYFLQRGMTAQPISSIVAAALGDERARELRALGADMDWDQAVAYTLAQIAQVLGEFQP